MSWKDWTYQEWNEHLIDHHFLGEGASLDEPVERIPATPEELVLVGGDVNADPGDVAKAFVDQIVIQLPRNGRSFCGFCQDYGPWTPDSENAPHFFGMLWFTCLVAYGYRTQEGQYYRRVSDLLGKTDNFQSHGPSHRSCLPDLWEDFRRWTYSRHATGAPIRNLLLPPEVGIRTAIGFSWFLTFPHKRDRNLLAKCLWDAGLVGFEPPIQPVLKALESKRKNFSREFKEDLDDFISRFVEGDSEPRTSAFWRAVRQEALDPSVGQSGVRLDRGPRIGLVALDSEEGLRPLVCCPAYVQDPSGFTKVQLDEPIGPFSCYLTDPGGSLDAPAEDALNNGRLLGLAHRKLVEQGILVFREHSTDLYTVVSGSEAYGASLALVRSDLVDAFVETFNGRKLPSLVEGWTEVVDCRVRAVDPLPPRLSEALQLIPTMQAPVLSAVGGIRVPGGFFFFENFLPALRALGASQVVVVSRDRREAPCAKGADEGVWTLPFQAVPHQGELLARAVWLTEQQGIRRERSAETRLRFVDFAVDDEFKGLRPGFYFIEACTEPEISLQGGPISLGITCEDGGQSADLVAIEGGTRYLGPGLGEMSLLQSPGFDWLAVGPKNHPDLLLFVGDPDHPHLPTLRRSPDSGDRRHWKLAFTSARRKAIRCPDGQYSPLVENPNVSAAYFEYRNHKVPEDAPVCEKTDLETLEVPVTETSSTAESTLAAADALTALSARRSGLPYEDIKNIFSTLMSSRNFLAIQQVLRGWAECGLIDIVRDAYKSRLTVVARRPSLVMVRRGPDAEATVVGLLGSVRNRKLREALSRRDLGLKVDNIEAPNPWQPPLARIRGPQDRVEEAGKFAGLERAVWLDWPELDELPAHFDVNNAYKTLPAGAPPPAYKLNARWNWDEAVFRRSAEESTAADSVEIERRIHPDGSSVYVVLAGGGEPFCWTHLRNWALLVGYDLKGQPPFLLDSYDRLICSGRSPVHLPLPIARLCALAGAGLPGPVFGGTAGEVKAYVYPFGRRLFRLISGTLPRSWLRSQC